ncbi:metallophosphoesterase [Salarchaeum sp. JOR-1]|uniref:metallophosphoesterase n=1 Tax=Salarchaeum sp. JOR-1 TaxID=2599399 RepID=UPI0011988A03|nr:metallophosphoesterase [Salarchaeum sp. JOR-1]QDX40244.1 metallophosphoesterase [Salarchaeum sp. JOR-1]
MIAVVADTHSETGHELAGRTREAVEAASVVLHAGDFTTEAALDAFHDAANRMHAVHGNADTRAVRDRLPAARTVELDGVRVAMTHTERGGETGLAMFGRQRGAPLVISGHTHRPTVTNAGGVVLLNPGTHAEPRGYPVTHAELEPTEAGLSGEIRRQDGTVVESFGVEGRT